MKVSYYIKISLRVVWSADGDVSNNDNHKDISGGRSDNDDDDGNNFVTVVTMMMVMVAAVVVLVVVMVTTRDAMVKCEKCVFLKLKIKFTKYFLLVLKMTIKVFQK